MLRALLTFLLASVYSQEFDFPCRVTDDEKVDWFVLYKTTNRQGTIKYFSSAAPDEFKDGTLSGSGETAPLQSTILPFLTVPENHMSTAGVAYSNQPPHFSSPTARSQSKGIILFGDKIGSWIIHTLPQFVKLDQSSVEYEPSEKAGMAVCYTMLSHNLPVIFEALEYADPVVYFTRRGELSSFADRRVQSFLNSDVRRPPKMATVLKTSTEENLPITIYAKKSTAYVDFFSRYVALVLRTSLRVRFDATTFGKIDNYCAGLYKTENIEGDVTVDKQLIPSRQEDSVWAISKNGSVVCFSDTGRTESGLKLGTLAACVESPKIYAHFTRIADSSSSSTCPD